MRKIQIEYLENLPIKFQLLNIKKTPLLWQDSLRIFFLLEGDLKIQLGPEWFNLHEGEIEIVNKGEIYKVEALEENKVLVLDIHPNFFIKYNDEVEDIYYYTNTMENKNQRDEKYEKLREYISKIFYEYIYRNKDYEEKIEKELLSMMYHLLNEFHHLYYEEESALDEDSLREDQVQFQRFNRIINYIRRNYNQSISLKSIAEKEYLTPQYLSYKIKDTFGQNYNDFLNIIRIEESRKPLLIGEDSINKIALDVGFSHSRYYNKHFKKIYKLSPKEYRDKYYKSYKELKAAIQVKRLNLEEGVLLLRNYIPLEIINRKDKIAKRNLELIGQSKGKLKIRNGLYIDYPEFILEKENLRYLKEVKTFLNIDNIYLNSEYFNKYWNLEVKAKELIEMLLDYKFKPKVVVENLNKKGKRLIKDIEEELELKILAKDIKLLEEENYNGMKSQIKVLEENLNYKEGIIPKLKDYRGKEFFSREIGLYTSKGVKKPLFYLYEILLGLEGDIYHMEPGLIFTGNKLNYNILIYPSQASEEIQENIRLSLNIASIYKDFQIKRIELSSYYGSIYDAWKKLGRPKDIEEDLIEEFKEYIRPRITYSRIKRGNTLNIVEDIRKDQLILYKFMK